MKSERRRRSSRPLEPPRRARHWRRCRREQSRRGKCGSRRRGLPPDFVLLRVFKGRERKGGQERDEKRERASFLFRFFFLKLSSASRRQRARLLRLLLLLLLSSSASPQVQDRSLGGHRRLASLSEEVGLDCSARRRGKAKEEEAEEQRTTPAADLSKENKKTQKKTHPRRKRQHQARDPGPVAKVPPVLSVSDGPDDGRPDDREPAGESRGGFVGVLRRDQRRRRRKRRRPPLVPVSDQLLAAVFRERVGVGEPVLFLSSFKEKREKRKRDK